MAGTLYYLLQHASAVPKDDDWLSPSERQVLAALQAPRRRRDWRLGRWTGKLALVRAGVLGARAEENRAEWRRISIRADAGGVPRVLLDESGAGWAISLSHSREYGFCCTAREPAVVGCDVETIGRRGEEFVVHWFTDAEREKVAGVAGEARSSAVTVIWSAKESAVKALGVGLRMNARDVRVDPGDLARFPAWNPLIVHTPTMILHGWWRVADGRALTLLGDSQPGMPSSLCAEEA